MEELRSFIDEGKIFNDASFQAELLNKILSAADDFIRVEENRVFFDIESMFVELFPKIGIESFSQPEATLKKVALCKGKSISLHINCLKSYVQQRISRFTLRYDEESEPDRRRIIARYLWLISVYYSYLMRYERGEANRRVYGEPTPIGRILGIKKTIYSKTSSHEDKYCIKPFLKISHPGAMYKILHPQSLIFRAIRLYEDLYNKEFKILRRKKTHKYGLNKLEYAMISPEVLKELSEVMHLSPNAIKNRMTKTDFDDFWFYALREYEEDCDL